MITRQNGDVSTTYAHIVIHSIVTFIRNAYLTLFVILAFITDKCDDTIDIIYENIQRLMPRRHIVIDKIPQHLAVLWNAHCMREGGELSDSIISLLAYACVYSIPRVTVYNTDGDGLGKSQLERVRERVESRLVQIVQQSTNSHKTSKRAINSTDQLLDLRTDNLPFTQTTPYTLRVHCIANGHATLLRAVQSAVADPSSTNETVTSMTNRLATCHDIHDVDMLLQCSHMPCLSTAACPWALRAAEIVNVKHERKTVVTEKAFVHALHKYAGRDRRFGK